MNQPRKIITSIFAALTASGIVLLFWMAIGYLLALMNWAKDQPAWLHALVVATIFFGVLFGILGLAVAYLVIATKLLGVWSLPLTLFLFGWVLITCIINDEGNYD